MTKKMRILFVLLLVVVFISGCSEYHADTPEFTTNADRATGFEPKTISESKENANHDPDRLSSSVEDGISDVKEKGQEIQVEISSMEKELEK